MKQSTEVKFLFHKDKILAQAQEHGDVNKIETWKKAFPNINFSNVINDTDIHWETEFNPTEIAAYVAIMTNTAVARISYSLEEMDSMNITDAEIDQFTLLMNCWIAHLFTYFENNKFIVNPNARELLLQYANEEEGFVDSLELTHEPVVKQS